MPHIHSTEVETGISTVRIHVLAVLVVNLVANHEVAVCAEGEPLPAGVGVETAAECRRSDTHNLVSSLGNVVYQGDGTVFVDLFPLGKTVIRVYTGPLGHVPGIDVFAFADYLVDVTAAHHNICVIRKFKDAVVVETHVESYVNAEVFLVYECSVNCKLNTHVADLTYVIHDGEETGGRRHRGLEENLAVDGIIEVNRDIPVVAQGPG